MKFSNSTGSVTMLTLVAALGGLLFGWDTAVISGTVSSLQSHFISPLNLPEAEANSLLGTLVSCALIGCVIGGAIAGKLAQLYGRKKMLIVSAALFFVSALGSAFPEMFFYPIGSEESRQALPQFMFYRIIGGIGVGMASLLSPLYIAEIAPPKIRGKLVSFNQMAIVTGIIVVYFVNYLIALQGNENWIATVGWRYMFASEMLPAAVFFGLLFTVPESPRWLALSGQQAQAKSTLESLHGKTEAKAELQAINNSIAGHTSGKLLSYGILVLVIGVALSVFQQVTGINAVLYYAPEIFKTIGAETNAAMLQTILVGATNVAFTFVAIFTVDKWGRKPLMIVGALGMCLSMFILGFSFYFEAQGIGVLLAMLAYVACFSLSWGPVCWVLLSEIFPNKIRSKALSVAVAAQWITNYIVSWTFPMMNNSSYLTEQFNHGFAYWLYGSMGLFAALFIWKFVPETKGKSLEEMEKLWNNDTVNLEKRIA